MDCGVVDGVIVAKLDGPPVTSEFISVLRGLVDDPAVPDGLPLLIDVRDAIGGPSRQEIRAVTEFFVEHRQAFGTKGLLVKSKLQYGLARIGQMLGQNRGLDVQIFHDETAAMAQLRMLGAAE